MREEHDNSGILYKNPDKTAEHPRWPDYRGTVTVAGRAYWLTGWVKEGRKGYFLSLALKPRETAAPADPPYAAENDSPS